MIHAHSGSDFPFFSNLTPAQRDWLAQNTRQSSYEKGELIHSHDGNCLGMFRVLTGQVCVFMLSNEGREVALFRLKSGDCCVLSAACVIRQITFEVFIQAENACQIEIIPAHLLSALMRENPYVESAVYRLAVEHFSDVMWTMQQILFNGFDQRLADFLLRESETTGSPLLVLTHEQIARYTGSVREVVSRMLKRFADEGAISLTRGAVRILDPEKLRQKLS